MLTTRCSESSSGEVPRPPSARLDTGDVLRTCWESVLMTATIVTGRWLKQKEGPAERPDAGESLEE